MFGCYFKILYVSGSLVFYCENSKSLVTLMWMLCWDYIHLYLSVCKRTCIYLFIIIQAKVNGYMPKGDYSDLIVVPSLPKVVRASQSAALWIFSSVFIVMLKGYIVFVGSIFPWFHPLTPAITKFNFEVFWLCVSLQPLIRNYSYLV